MDRQELSRRQYVAAVGTAVASGLAGCSVEAPFGGSTEGAGPSGPPPTPAVDLEDPTDSAQIAGGSTYTEVYRQTVDSVAAVRVESGTTSAQGSAWVYDNGYLVTNEHVVSEGRDVSAWFSEAGWRDADVVGTDVYSDLAVVETSDMPDEATSLSFVESPPPVGTHVAAIGNPYGLTGSLSAGIISGRGRSLPAPSGFAIPDAIQTDMGVNPGNSGGPMVTLDGNVAGVINATGGDNISFAISAALASRVVPSLIQNGRYDHAYMGIELEEVTPLIARANDVPVTYGIYVDETVDGTPAEGVLQGSSGQRRVDGQRVSVGGDVIVQLGETTIENSPSLSRYLALSTSPGDTIDVGIYRDGERQTVQLGLGRRPDP